MISVVLPAYNEADTLQSTVTDVLNYMQSRNEDFEIIIVENGSTDDTLAIASTLAIENDSVFAFNEDIPDYGRALRKGFREANGEIVINFDVDFYDFDFLERAVSIIREESPNRPGIVVGSKRALGANDKRSPIRRFATFTFSTLLKVGFGLGVSDTHGIKAIHRPSVLEIEKHCAFTVDLFDTELILRSERNGIIVSEIPVTVEESRPARSNLISRIPRTLLGLTKMRLLFFYEAIFRRNELRPVKLK
jgi:glycosyltransferase involved in cell wall biosynthesis